MGGEGLGFVVTDYFAVSRLGSAGSIAGGSVGPLGWVLCASGYLFKCPVRLRCSILGG